jgi:hypothetical protein
MACRPLALAERASRSHRAIREGCTRSSTTSCRRAHLRTARVPGVPPGRGGGAGAAGNAPPAPPAGGVYRSDDAGATWTRLSGDNALWGRGWYFEKIAVDPKNADIVYVANVSISRSMDGGKSWVPLRGSPGGDDYHQIWISPDDTNTLIVASDQGTVITRNARSEDPREVTWSSWLNQPIAQIYRLSVDYRFPYWVTGAQQDSGAVAVRSRGKFAQISTRDWEPIGAGGESGMTAGDWLHPGIIYGANGQRYDLETNLPVPSTTPQMPQEKRRARTGRSRWCSQRPTTRCTTQISTCSERPTKASRGSRSAPTSHGRTQEFRRTWTPWPRPTPIATGVVG